MRPNALVLIAALLALITSAAAQPQSPPLAWWRFDPSGFGEGGGDGERARGAAEAGLRIAASSGLIGDDQTVQLVHALLAASAVGGAPHSLVIYDLALAGEREGTVRLERISAALHLQTRAQHAELVRNIQTILVDAAPGEQGAPKQRPLELPGGRKGVAFSREGWSAAREVSWSSHEDGFTVGLGRGALERWFAQSPGAPVRAAGAIAAHRAAVSDRDEAGSFFEMYVDLNALRHALEPLDDEDRVTPILAPMHLANARDVMLHGAWIGAPGEDALLAFDATWSLRSERPGIVHRRRITADGWPDEFLLPRPPSPPARYAIAAEIAPADVIREAVALCAGTLDEVRRREFDAAHQRWQRQNAAAMRRIIQSLGSRVMVSDHPRPAVAVPGATTVFIPLTPGVDRDRFERDVGQVLAGFDDVVVWDEQERAWSLFLDERRLVRLATWGIAEVGGDAGDGAGRPRRNTRFVLVGGFDLTLGEGAPSALLRANRAWIGQLSDESRTGHPARDEISTP